jgi:hypothetical protein
MAPDSLYWIRRGMPTANPIGSFYTPLTNAHEYLRQREAGYELQSRTEESKYYPKGYWTSSSLAFVKPVLDKLGSSRFSDLRANYLLVMWDQFPTGCKMALFSGLAVWLLTHALFAVIRTLWTT